ncbi:ciliary microtubule inner protein 2C-like isoform X1 [Littorina saxatilis]|uniref:Ciliary microtubule inner protein 2C n=1 Tax=Littorina saxatilis TaxID=31220 RepID=A0AAN9B8Q2_9CAEN
MSRAAGTLITTNNATYFPPRFMPGYRGYCPTMKYDYGETYGNATSKYFQDYRSSVLNSSASNYSNGGQFPTYYTHNPDMVISNRSRNQDRWLLSPKYQLSNVDHDRSEQIRSVDYLSHKHREHYKDKTGTLKSVDFFKLPVSAEDQFRTKDVFIIMSTKYSDDINLPNLDHAARRQPLIRRFNPKTNLRDREMRDVHFEKR